MDVLKINDDDDDDEVDRNSIVFRECLGWVHKGYSGI